MKDIRQKRGFTLVELLVVIAIIGVLVAALAAGGTSSTGSSQADAVCQSFPSSWFGVS